MKTEKRKKWKNENNNEKKKKEKKREKKIVIKNVFRLLGPMMTLNCDMLFTHGNLRSISVIQLYLLYIVLIANFNILIYLV